jgi:hypothetical protein
MTPPKLTKTADSFKSFNAKAFSYCKRVIVLDNHIDKPSVLEVFQVSYQRTIKCD